MRNRRSSFEEDLKKNPLGERLLLLLEALKEGFFSSSIVGMAVETMIDLALLISEEMPPELVDEFTTRGDIWNFVPRQVKFREESDAWSENRFTWLQEPTADVEAGDNSAKDPFIPFAGKPKRISKYILRMLTRSTEAAPGDPLRYEVTPLGNPDLGSKKRVARISNPEFRAFFGDLAIYLVALMSHPELDPYMGFKQWFNIGPFKGKMNPTNELKAKLSYKEYQYYKRQRYAKKASRKEQHI
jgi:hypothetical protein